MVKRLLVCCVVMAMCAQAAAQAVVLDLTGVKPGVYFLRAELKSDGTLSISAMHFVSLGGLVVPPLPPTPPAPPSPEIPAGEFGLTRVAYTEAMKVAEAPRKLSQGLAKNFEAEAAAIAAGARASVQASQDALKVANRATLANDADRAAWLDWFVAWQAVAAAANAEGKLKTVEDYGKAYRATADGLKLVK